MATNTKQRGLFLKRNLSLFLAVLLLLGVNMLGASAAGTDAPTESGTYTVPITSLVSKAPLAPIQAAFAGAFGESVKVTVDDEGGMTAAIRTQHMVINFMGIYHANVMKIEGATVHSHKTELSSTTFGDTDAVVEIEVPDEISFPLPQANENGSFIIPLTVDFMNSFMGGGDDYWTDVTLTLDFENAEADTAELSALIALYRELAEENYTPETWSALQDVLAQAETMAADGASMAEIKAMIAQLNTVKENLAWVGGDYGKVEDALAGIPADPSLYTEASWNALMAAKDAVQQGLGIDRQAEINAFAAEIEAKIAALVYRDADYAGVDGAIADAPEDLSKYTDESVKALQEALGAVVRGLKANEQARVDKMAGDIEAAVKGLTEKSTGGSLDKDNLSNGIYEVSVQLWHAANDNASMAAASFEKTARIVVKDGASVMYVYTKPMTFGAITASLQEMKVAGLNGNYAAAKVEKKDASGNPTCFSFALPHSQEYIAVKVNPRVEMMGNQDMDARIRAHYTTLKKVSDDSDDTSVDVTKPENENTAVPQTGDSAPVLLPILLASAFACVILLLAHGRKRRENAA